MPSNRQVILELIRSEPGLSDQELGERSGVTPHQQVNRICRVLAGRGLIRRVRRQGGVIVNDPLPAVESDDLASAHPSPVDVGAHIAFASVGEVTVQGDKVRIPELPHHPGLYRFTVRSPGEADTVYFGEAADLARRMNGYRNPGSSQQTNQRINQIFRDALSAGGTVHVAMADTATFKLDGRSREADLRSVFMRRMLENASVVFAQTAGNATLNAGSAPSAPGRPDKYDHTAGRSTVRRIDGPTPAGGAYAEAFHVNGQVVEIVEYDADGSVLARQYAARDDTAGG